LKLIILAISSMGGITPASLLAVAFKITSTRIVVLLVLGADSLDPMNGRSAGAGIDIFGP
jgi:hypothetical protein